MGLFNRLGQVIKSMFGLDTIEEKIGKKAIMSSEMKNAVKTWSDLYKNDASWLDNNTKGLNIAPGIAAEIARLVTLELNSCVSGSLRADYINTIYQTFLSNLRNITELACAKGGVMLKPFLSDGGICIDVVNAELFYPTEQNSNGDICGAVFVSTKTIGDKYYTKLEVHSYKKGTEYIENTAYMSDTKGLIGRRINLNVVSEWADILPKCQIENLKQPLFVYFKMPFSNSIDDSSPLGVSIYSRAVNLLKDADEQYSRLLWEYEGGELAVFADEAAVEQTDDNGDKKEMPKRFRRLILKGQQMSSAGDGYHEYAPTLRDNSYINGLNTILKRIEFNSSLAYGTLSDPQNVDKTAQEIKASKQRSFAAVSDIQKSLENSLKNLIYAIGVWCDIAKLCKSGEVQSSFDWSDNIVTDRDTEFAQRKELCLLLAMQPWELRQWYTGEDEKTAKKMCAISVDEFRETE